MELRRLYDIHDKLEHDLIRLCRYFSDAELDVINEPAVIYQPIGRTIADVEKECPGFEKSLDNVINE